MPTPNSGIPYVPENTTDPAAGLNLSLNVIDALLTPEVLGLGTTTPPGSPSDGDLYIVGAAATGDWAGEHENLARYVAEGDFWQFYTAGVQAKAVLYLGAWYTFQESSGWVGAGVPTIDADGVAYDNATSGLTATDVQAAIDEIAASITPSSDGFDLVTEASAYSVDPATHSGRGRIVLAGGNATFAVAEGYSAGEAYSIRATGSVTLVGSGVTLTPPADGTLVMSSGMTVTVVMTSSSAGFVIGQTVAA